MTAVSTPVLVGGAIVELGASVGVACGSGEAADADRLLLEADRAMYAAKHAGRGCVRVAARSFMSPLQDETHAKGVA